MGILKEHNHSFYSEVKSHKGFSTRITPAIETINNSNTKLTEGELALTKYLDTYLPNQWEIYLQPYLNGDRPDIVILNPKIGLMIFEVKDWNPKLYSCKNTPINGKGTKTNNIRRFYVQTEKGNQPIQSPINQVERYRENIIGLYLPFIGEEIDKNPKSLGAFKVGVYFHNYNSDQLDSLLSMDPRRCTIFGNETLESGLTSLTKVVPDIGLKYSMYMSRRWYEYIKSWLCPPFHSMEQGTPILLSKEQQKHSVPAPKEHQRVRGAAGSGKSLVIAQRAARLASQGKRVLIVTFNITLRYYIHDFIKRSAYNFNWEDIEINHFHGFCRDFLLENDVAWPDKGNASDSYYLSQIVPDKVLESRSLGHNRKNRMYDAILIDEGQDFEQLWYETLCQFLSQNDEVLFVIDEKQNIYGKQNKWINAMHGSKFRGRWRLLNTNYRVPCAIMDKANEFAKQFIPEYHINDCVTPRTADILEPYYGWHDLTNRDSSFKIVLKQVNWLVTSKNVHPQDIVILVPNKKEGLKIVSMLKKHGMHSNHVFDDDSEYHRHKASFWMGDSRIKVCTIHSFKGWEIMNVVLLTPDEGDYDDKVDYLMYTALTRTRSSLIVLNRTKKYVPFGKSWPNSQLN